MPATSNRTESPAGSENAVPSTPRAFLSHISPRTLSGLPLPQHSPYVLFCLAVLARYASHRRLSSGIAGSNTGHSVSALPVSIVSVLQTLLSHIFSPFIFPALNAGCSLFCASAVRPETGL